jgi:hypothetical protein
VIALVSTVAGTFAVDLETDEVEPAEPFVPAPTPVLNLPRVIAAAAAGSTVVAVVDIRPPLVVSYDAGATWNESGRGLPAGRAVAIAEESPDTMLYAARNRLYVSRNGGVFWEALALELPEIEAVALRAG